MIDILYEDGPVMGLVKPAGLSTQAPPGIDSLESRIKSFLEQRENKPGNVYLAVVHRLDRPVSGVILVCKHVRAARALSRQFEFRSVKKVYWALVAGQPSPETGVWTDYMRKLPGRAQSEIVPQDHPEAQLAILRYRTLESLEQGTWLEIELDTGRTHQIRVQAAARGHAVWGDAQYGSAIHFGPVTDDERARAIALHARRIDFTHPMTRTPVSLTAPLPETWDVVKRE
jgi:23S rRNA pseudouridine1911/1915/1917 synthase